MVDFISWHEAQARAKDEPVVFAEVVSDDPEGQSLEIHVMTPTVRGLHEAQRDDTGRIPRDQVHAFVGRIAAERNVRYATIRSAEDQWPPEWIQQRRL
jgi:hypothetical protein